MNISQQSYWYRTWNQFKRHRLGLWALYLIILFVLAAVYAPFLASSKPIFVLYQGEPYFPLFRYLFYTGFYTKGLDIFFNILIFTLPLMCLAIWISTRNKKVGVMMLLAVLAAQVIFFFIIEYISPMNPAGSIALNKARHDYILKYPGVPLSWEEDLSYMTSYAKLNLLIDYKNSENHHKALLPYAENYAKISPGGHKTLPTIWQLEQDRLKSEIARLQENPEVNQEMLNALKDRSQWIQDQSSQLRWMIMPLLSHFHWEDDAGGQEALNSFVPWTQLTRVNRKDLLSALIFGIRISIVVGLVSVTLALLIGIPIGALAGFYGGKFDIVVSRLLEIWESMPTFFMLLMIVAILQNKSIFLVIIAIGLFSWPTFSRYIRGEFFKQRNLSYVEACRAQGFKNAYIMFKQILPNAIPPVLALLPFAIMGAITAEAGLSFLGLGEEGSTSWGVLMDEGRTAFPAESYLLWPPAILLTVFLVAIALVGDSLRDTLDPKMYSITE